MSAMSLDEEKGEAGTVGAVTIENSLPRNRTTKSCFATSGYKLPIPGRPWHRIRKRFKRTRTAPDARREPIVRQIHKTPIGYPKLAAFLDSDDNFMVYRRFGYLQSRLLLEKQDDLRLLENELDRLDRAHAREDPESLMTREVIEDEVAKPQAELLCKIEKKFCEYSNLLTSAQALTSLNKPSLGEYTSVEAWINNAKPCYDAEHSFIYRKEDLVTLRPGREHAWLDSSVESLLKKCKCKPLEYLFRSKETRLKSDCSFGEAYFTRQRIERFVIGIIVLMILILLVIPIYLLYHITDDSVNPKKDVQCMGILLVSTLAFSACISLFTRAKRHEILAASAAYCAVLVVFIGNIGSQRSGGLVPT